MAPSFRFFNSVCVEWKEYTPFPFEFYDDLIGMIRKQVVFSWILSLLVDNLPDFIYRRRETAKKYRQMFLFCLDEDGEMWFNSI